MCFWIFDFAYFELVERFHLLFVVLLDGFVDMADRWSWFATRILFMTLILFTRASRKRLGTLQYSQCVSKRSQLKSYTYHMLIICFFFFQIPEYKLWLRPLLTNRVLADVSISDNSYCCHVFFLFVSIITSLLHASSRLVTKFWSARVGKSEKNEILSFPGHLTFWSMKDSYKSSGPSPEVKSTDSEAWGKLRVVRMHIAVERGTLTDFNFLW